MTGISPRARLSPLELALRHPLTQLGFGLLAWGLLYYNYLLLTYAASLHWNDFGKFFYATASWWNGRSMYAPTVATYMPVGDEWMQFLDLNPPHFHLVVLPMIAWPLHSAAIVWTLANVGCGIAALVLVYIELRPTIHPSRIFPLLWVVLASAATGANALTAQCTGLLMLPMAVAWRSARHGQWNTSGAWLGVLISVKPFLGLFLPVLLLVRRPRAALAACTAGLCCVALGVAVFGWRPYLEWMVALRQVGWDWAGMNGSLRAILARGFDTSPVVIPVVLAPSLITPLWVIASLVVGAASVRAVSRSTDGVFAVTVLAALLISPLGWVYYLWLAVPGCLGLWSAGVPRLAWVGLLVLCTPLFSLSFFQPSSIATLTLASAYTWATLALWISTVRAAQATPTVSAKAGPVTTS